MKKYKLIIFDLDGTIADTSPGILNSVRYTQQKLDLPEISLEAMYRHVGPPMEESYYNNFRLEGEMLYSAVKFHKEYAMNQGYLELELYPEMDSTLNKLKQKGYLIAIATLKADATAKKIFDNLKLSDKFDIIVGTNQTTLTSKEQVILKCISELKEAKEDVLLVGDSHYDAIGAEKVGVDFLGVLYGFGFQAQEEVAKYQNIGSIKKVSDIWYFLE